MSYYLFLDDQRKPSDVTWIELPLAEWVIVRDHAQFRSTLEQRGRPSFIAFDHDLAKEHYGADFSTVASYAGLTNKTGFDCAVTLVDFCAEHKLPLPEFACHTLNRAGADNINSLLRAYQRFCLRQATNPS